MDCIMYLLGNVGYYQRWDTGCVWDISRHFHAKLRF
nr:MAG TPA: hypothetical protein [Caudoviricetes sp.]